MKGFKKFVNIAIKPYSVYYLNAILNILLYFALTAAGVYSWVAFGTTTATACITVIISIMKELKEKEPINLISMSFNYMLEGGVEVDNILDILINNKQKKRVFKSSKSLFKVIDGRIARGGYEDKRLVAESIGALYKVDRRRTLEIIKKLRHDAVDPKWGDDIRRRVVEEFDYLGRREKDFIREYLEPNDTDSIYTIIAIIEVACLENKFFSQKEKEHIFAELKKKLTVFDEVINEPQVKEFLEEVELFIKGFNEAYSDKEKLKDFIKNTFYGTNNKYIKIIIAKNIASACNCSRACGRKGVCIHPDCQSHVLELFEMCFDKNNHRNIRRPMAREEVCACLFQSYRQAQFQKRIVKNIMALVKDDDYIIPNTFLDYAGQLYETDPDLYARVIAYFTDEGPILELAGRIKKELPPEIRSYVDYISEHDRELYRNTIVYYLTKKDMSAIEDDLSALHDKLRLQERARRVDHNIRAIMEYQKNS